MLKQGGCSIRPPKTFACSLSLVERLNSLTEPLEGLAQPVDPLDLVLCQSADARMRAAGIRDGARHHELVGAGGVGDANLHAVEMASHKGGVLVTERHI